MKRFSFSGRGQGTLEYLVILAVVVTISLAIVGLSTNVLGNSSSSISTNSSKVGSILGSGIGISEGVLDTNGNAVVRLLNTSGDSFTVSKIAVSGTNSTYPNVLVPRGGGGSFSLNSLGGACACVAGETTHNCSFAVTLTSDTGLARTQTVNKTLNCVSTTTPGAGVNAPITLQALWAQNGVAGTGTARDEAFSVFVDSVGNVYIAGDTRSDLNFSPTVGITWRAGGGALDFFVAKYDSSGNALWARNPTTGTGTNTDAANSVFVDSGGNVYVAGYTTGDLNFSPTVSIKYRANTDFFVVKYDSSGNALWAQNAAAGSGAGDEYANAVVVDSSSNVYIAGYTTTDLNFSPMVGITNRGGKDFFLAKYDSSGNALWAANPFVGTGTGDDYANSASIDSLGNVYAAGDTASDMNFGSTIRAVYRGGGNDFFVVKYNSSGVAQWTQNPVAGTGTVTDEGNSVYVDASGNVYVTGYTNGDLNFSSTVGVKYRFGNDFFVVKYDSSGNALWAQNAVTGSGTGTDRGTSVFADSSGNVYVTGYTDADLNFSSTIGITNRGLKDFFVVKYDSSGNALWAQNATAGTGTSHDIGFSVFADSSLNVYLAGYTYSDLNFSSTVGVKNRGDYDFFVTKYTWK